MLFRSIVNTTNLVEAQNGSIYERYTVYKEISENDLVEIKLIENKVTKEIRTLKIIKKVDCNPKFVQKEIDLLKIMDHPNIGKMYEYSEDENNYYIVMEYCSGGTLYDKIHNKGEFSEIRIANIMKQLFSAVAFCHHKGIIHGYSYITR